MSQEELIEQGEAAQTLLETPVFNQTINQLLNSTYTTFFNSKPSEFKERETAHQHYQAIVDIVSTLRQKVEIKDEILVTANQLEDGEDHV